MNGKNQATGLQVDVEFVIDRWVVPGSASAGNL